MKITGYKSIDYTQFQLALQKAFTDYLKNQGSEFKVADHIGVKTIQTVRNCFSPVQQKVADKVLTGVMEAIEFDGAVVWENGNRYYFVKGK